jgi:hypothetical protein
MFCWKKKIESKSKQKTYTAPLQPIPFTDVIKECYDTQLVGLSYPISKVIHNAYNTKRAIILDRKGFFQIWYEVLFAYADDELEYVNYHHGYWAHDGVSCFVDTLEHAERIITENIEFMTDSRL